MKIKHFYFIVAAALATSCSEQKPVAKEEKFCLSDTMKNSIRLDRAGFKTVYNELQLSGKISANEDKVVRVFPLAGGVVEDIKVELGDFVQKGQTLIVIKSGEIADFNNQMISAQSNLIIAQKNHDVAQDMYQSGLASEKEVVIAKRELQKAESELKKTEEILRIYDVDKSSYYTIKAPISGFIIEKNISENMQFRTENSSNLFTISGLDEVWVLANVYESDINKIKVGYDANIKVLSYPNKRFTGKIDKIFNVLDPSTRVMKVRVKINNEGYNLKPEMSAQVTVKYADKDKKALSIPSSSIIFDKNRNFVLVYKDPCTIDTREITISHQACDTTYIIDGVSENEEVISRAQLLVYNALNQ